MKCLVRSKLSLFSVMIVLVAVTSGCFLIKKKKSHHRSGAITPHETPSINSQIINHLRINVQQQLAVLRQERMVASAPSIGNCLKEEKDGTDLMQSLPFFSTGSIGSPSISPAEIKMSGQLYGRGKGFFKDEVYGNSISAKILKYDSKADSVSLSLKDTDINVAEQTLKFGKIPKLDQISINGEPLNQSDSLDGRNNHRIKFVLEKGLTFAWSVINPADSDIILIRITSTPDSAGQCLFSAKSGSGFLSVEYLQTLAKSEESPFLLSVFLLHYESLVSANSQWLLSSVDDRNIEAIKGI